MNVRDVELLYGQLSPTFRNKRFLLLESLPIFVALPGVGNVKTNVLPEDSLMEKGLFEKVG